MASRILALDCGRSVGWARSDGKFGTLALNQPDNANSFHAWMLWLADQCSEWRPTLVLLEQPFMASRMRDADFTPTLVNIAHTIANVHGVPRREMPAVSVRKIIFGQARGLSDKDRIAWVRHHAWLVANDHEADAVALLWAWQAQEATAA